MSKIANIGTYELDPDDRDFVVRALLDHRERCLAEESGTLEFHVLVPSEERSRLFLYELYVDSAAFAAHLSGRSLAILREQIGSKIKSRLFYKCTPAGESATVPQEEG